jgi:O-antigen/teichoic acid export membrane protein
LATQSTRKTILMNSLWGNANILVRYLTSFVATAIIAANYSPKEFGLYQLVLTYLAIIESINLLSPNHLRSHLVQNPEDESAVVSVWFCQTLGLWAASTVVLLGCALVLKDDYFWWLLAVGNIRLIFKAYDYVSIIADYRLRNEMSQKLAIIIQGSFNFFRIVFALLKAGMFTLVSLQIVQGVFGAIYQLFHRKKLQINTAAPFSWQKYKELVLGGGLLSIVTFLASLQMRFVTAFAAERMSVDIFGNFQLVLKLVEPATSIGAVVFAANFTVLAHTFHNSRQNFNKRFLKISLLSVGIAAFCGVVICVFPTSLLLKAFGSAYLGGLQKLWLGAGLIIANTVLSVSVQYDMILGQYRKVIIKYGAIFIAYLTFFLSVSTVSLEQGLALQCLVPLCVVIVFDGLKKITSNN